jgi:hypothetical protein
MSAAPPLQGDGDELRTILKKHAAWALQHHLDEPGEMLSTDEALAALKQRDQRIRQEARLVELDLLEQAINGKWDMNEYKLYRLAQLKDTTNT